MNRMLLPPTTDVSDVLLASRNASLIADPHRRNARALEKRAQVLAFLRDEIWTTTGVIATLLKLKYPAAHALMQRMQSLNLITSAPVFIPSPKGAKRVVLHGITAEGLVFAWPLDQVPEYRRPWESGKTNPLFVPHQIEVQLARIRAEHAGWTAWRPARQLMGSELPKVPDAEGIDPAGVPVAVEVEREIKTDRRYEAVIGAYIVQMKQDNRWQRVDYLCPNVDFAARLARAFGRLRHLRLESKDEKMAKVGDLHQSHLDRFRFYAASEWPGGRWIEARLSIDIALVKLVARSDSVK